MFISAKRVATRFFRIVNVNLQRYQSIMSDNNKDSWLERARNIGKKKYFCRFHLKKTFCSSTADK